MHTCGVRARLWRMRGSSWLPRRPSSPSGRLWCAPQLALNTGSDIYCGTDSCTCTGTGTVPSFYHIPGEAPLAGQL